MKNWEIELMGVMAKSNVDNTQKDVIEFINGLIIEINSEIEKDYLPVTLEDVSQEWYRMGKNRMILDISEKIKKRYIRD